MEGCVRQGQGRGAGDCGVGAERGMGMDKISSHVFYGNTLGLSEVCPYLLKLKWWAMIKEFRATLHGIVMVVRHSLIRTVRVKEVLPADCLLQYTDPRAETSILGSSGRKLVLSPDLLPK